MSALDTTDPAKHIAQRRTARLQWSLNLTAQSAVGRSAARAWRTALALAIAACSDPAAVAQPETTAAATDQTTARADVTADNAVVAPQLDAQAAETSVSCPGGAGCPCTTDQECDVGLCADDGSLPGGKACAAKGTAGCPSGWTAVTLAAGEGVKVCVPAAPRLCNPCAANSDCVAVGGTGSLCLSRGAAGNFCGIACPAAAYGAAGCPAGYSCEAAQGVGGEAAKQCVPVGAGGSAGACGCSVAASKAQLATVCSAPTLDATGKLIGACKGTRTCGSGGLSGCNAAIASAETCDGQDNNCNGLTDDGPLCDDGNACTSGDSCTAGKCAAGVAKVCTDANDCTADSCQAGTATCLFAPLDGALCSDGDPCTAGEKCSAGVCKGGMAQPCPCDTVADCTSKEDGNLCNGTLYCDGTAKQCLVNPATVVVCPDDGAPCTDPVCAPVTGKCAPVALPNGATCSDGKPWTTGDSCQGGACVPGVSNKLCGKDADCVKYEDGDLCNGPLFCNKAAGLCQVLPTTVVYCPSGFDTLCSKNLCQPASGQCKITAVADKVPCDDGNVCTTGEVCLAGACGGGAGTCACSADIDCAKYDDGDLCNGALFCNLAQGKCALNPATQVVCPTGLDTTCSKTVCVKATGKCAPSFAPDGASCDADGSPCTLFDTCSSGQCVPGAAICPCQQDADCPKWDDSDLCNGTLYCNKAAGQCTVNPKTVIACPAVQAGGCATATCAAATGKCSTTTAPDGQLCSDGDSCTAADSCSGGNCKAGVYACGGCTSDAECPDDGNPCNGAEGCDKTKPIHVCAAKPGTVPATGSACSDGNLCTLNDGCAAGKCTGAAVVCDDKSVCTDDKCDKGACVFTANAATCADGSVCTTNDTCSAKACKPGAALVCDDKDVCTTDSCDGKLGCVYTKNTAACSDGNACTVGDKCSGGVCLPGAVTGCSDANVCTSDACDPVGGCANLPTAGTCSDGDTCTEYEACSKGKCSGGVQLCNCGAGYLGIAVDVAGSVTVVCAPDVPVWGIEPTKPAVGAALGDGTVVDPLTQIVWQQSPDVPPNRNWSDARAYCDSLALAGQQDWRLPTRTELMSLLDRTKPGSAGMAIDTVVYANAQSLSTWSASPVAGVAGQHWAVRFDNGLPNDKIAHPQPDSSFWAVRCVRQAPPVVPLKNRFLAYPAKDIVYDTLTKRMWQRTAPINAADASGSFLWSTAAAYCPNLSQDGDGWAMPAPFELESLVDLSQAVAPAIDKAAFPATPSTWFWSTQSWNNNTSYMWSVEFTKGQVGQASSVAQKLKVRCVRTCDDNNPCTADGFDTIAGGCTHTNLAEGSACGTGNQACWAGVCGCGEGYLAVPIDDLGTKKTICAPEVPVWGIGKVSPDTLKDNANGTVSDSLTGLTWQKAPDTTKMYSQAAALAYCDGVVVAGKQDWRLPTRVELVSILDRTVFSPAPQVNGTLFPGTMLNKYWSASGVPTAGWLADFTTGGVENWAVATAGYPRCVRTGVVKPQITMANRFAAAATKGTFADSFAGRTWQLTTPVTSGDDAKGHFSWGAAKTYCNGLALDGGGWQLPTIVELESLVWLPAGVSVLVHPAIAAGTLAEDYWSATPQGTGGTSAHKVHFGTGGSQATSASSLLRVRCVRQP